MPGIDIHHADGNRFRGRRHFRQHLLDVDDFDQLIVDPGHRRQVMIASRALGRRMDLLPVHVDDAFHRAHQETLGLGVVLRDDHEGIALITQPTGTGRHRQIENRNSRPTNTRHTAHDRIGLGHQGQLGALQHLTNLEYVDPIQLLAVETEQQQLKAILPHQLRALVYRIHYTSHAQTPYTNAKCVATHIHH